MYCNHRSSRPLILYFELQLTYLGWSQTASGPAVFFKGVVSMFVPALRRTGPVKLSSVLFRTLGAIHVDLYCTYRSFDIQILLAWLIILVLHEEILMNSFSFIIVLSESFILKVSVVTMIWLLAIYFTIHDLTFYTELGKYFLPHDETQSENRSIAEYHCKF